MYSSSFDKFYVAIACSKDIYGRYCIQKSNNDHFHSQFTIIVLKIKSHSSLPVV